MAQGDIDPLLGDELNKNTEEPIENWIMLQLSPYLRQDVSTKPDYGGEYRREQELVLVS